MRLVDATRSASAYLTTRITEHVWRGVTVNETLVHHFEPESQKQSMESKKLGLPAKKKLKSQFRKVMVTTFWTQKYQ